MRGGSGSARSSRPGPPWSGPPLQLFAAKGFDDTTVEDIAEVVGVSPRTFHRYFARKDDVVLADHETRLERFLTRLHDGAASETVLGAVRHAALEAAAESSDRDRTRAEIIAATPALRAQNLSRYDDWAGAITEFAADAVGEEPGDRWPTVVGACAMASLTSARRRWLAVDGADNDALRQEYDDVLELIAGLDRPVTHAAESSGPQP